MLAASFQSPAQRRGNKTESESLTVLRRQRVKSGDAERTRICGHHTEEVRTAERERKREREREREREKRSPDFPDLQRSTLEFLTEC